MRRTATVVGLLLALALAGGALPGASNAGDSHRTDLSAAEKIRVETVTRAAGAFADAERYEAMQAGATTSIETPDRLAFSHFSANLPKQDEMRFRLGNALFRKLWVASPSSTQASDGLGPLYNARSCESCHKEDGRGHPPEGSADATSMFLRLAHGPKSDAEREALAKHLALNFPDPIYGRQLQDKAVPGVSAEGAMTIDYTEIPFAYPDRSIVHLRKPTYGVSGLNYGPLARDTTLSPRMAPAMIGLGLIEAIADSDIASGADPGDLNGDGVSGRQQPVHDSNGALRIGRFGWKAENATIRDQSAHAFLGDIGISTPDLPSPSGDCTELEQQCISMPNGEQTRLGKGEAPENVLSMVTFYSRHLAVPARRKASFPETLAGKALFYQSGCIACHRPKYVTRKDWPDAALRFQLIWPYSDFLLHDMGDGLADGQQVGEASGNEWRTPALWGIGLTKTVSGHSFFLHDGRARSLEEAILWHGGEAIKARDSYAKLAREDRQKLISFLESL
ncbi:c-type cytochrome [Rhizobium sp. KVB221]|uniref:C-type cytochrome n=1 Tax=Rhizobium setariae TaxID=2801340 RepID=A0A937CPG1_9HYPH|nr:di-heme oxidoredictase family protein [Rhizobium setariae]MBL0371767.1 c-type cytochrome [Rhizobium setariae]